MTSAGQAKKYPANLSHFPSKILIRGNLTTFTFQRNPYYSVLLAVMNPTYGLQKHCGCHGNVWRKWVPSCDVSMGVRRQFFAFELRFSIDISLLVTEMSVLMREFYEERSVEPGMSRKLFFPIRPSYRARDFEGR